jgi:hypothetical protein
MTKKFILIGLFILGVASGANAAEIALDTFLYESFSFGSTTVKTGTSTLTTDTTLDKWVFFEGYLSIENGAARYRTDSGTPTASEGHIFGTNTTTTITGLSDCRSFKAISLDGGTVTIRASYKRK